MGVVKWLVGGFVAIGVVMVGLLSYHATVLGGGLESWVLAAIWFVAMVLVVGVVQRSLVRRR